MHKFSNIAGLLLLAFPAFSQKAVTPDEAVRAALQNHPSVKAAAFDVQARKYAEKGALNLPNPDVNAESPTGGFYTLGISQSFEFPTVYARQKKVAKAETVLAQAGQQMSENELRYQVRSLYLESQLAAYRNLQWAIRDSLYQAIVSAAARQFAAGEIDFLQKIMAENEAGKVRQERLAAEKTLEAIRGQLADFTGLSYSGALTPLQPDTLGLNTLLDNFQGNPSIVYDQQAVQVAEQQIGLAKSRALPNFSIGYMNQGERSTPVDYRFRASVGVPLWAGQYRAGRMQAESQAQAAESRVEAHSQALKQEWVRAKTELVNALAKVQYYEREALPRSRSLLAAAIRMREAGQVDYVSFLRTLDEVFSIQRDYAEQLSVLNAVRLRMQYLLGQ